MGKDKNYVGHWVNLSRAYEIACLGDFSIKLEYNILNYPKAKEDFNIIKKFFSRVKFSEDGFLSIEIWKPDYTNKTSFETLKDIKHRVKQAKNNMVPTEYDKPASCESLFKTAIDRMELSLGQQNKVIKTASVIAQLANSDKIRIEHLAEAIQYSRGNYDDNEMAILPIEYRKFGVVKNQPIVIINEKHLTIDVISQIRNYLIIKEAELPKN